MSAKRPIRCAVYTRKSTEEGLEQDFNSLHAQREACEAYILSQKAEGWTAIAAPYDDGGYSGGTLERPALRRLLNDIEDGQLDVVVVYKIDRLSRSLMDFARLVEVFDRKSVTFVSVTQSFNTTTSMGRLTLNVLLSFAQFEREVTGERIRDKIAASKRKGIWMGGNPPLGYDVGKRKLIINEAEAETVRFIFERYLELGCVRLLCADLTKRRIVSKRRLFADGRHIGGTALSRSALYAILKNRVYVGETTHKGAFYKGEHEAIVAKKLFDAVQRKLADGPRTSSDRPQTPQNAPLGGLVFDETGAAMQPTYSVKQGSIRYGYYVSQPRLKGEPSKASINRLPAPLFESFIDRVLARVGLAHCEPRSVLHRIDILAHSVAVRLDRSQSLAHWRCEHANLSDQDIVEHYRAQLEAGEMIAEARDRLNLILPVRAKFRGGGSEMVYHPGEGERTPSPDLVLIKALARAHRWREMLMTGEADSIDAIARRFGLDRGHTGQILNLAFLSPKITRAILQGEQPHGLRLKHLIEADMPLDWREQEEFLGRLAQANRASPFSMSPAPK
jgi:DNA invertase Pin-like site-specific DNA recombinase